MKYHPLLKGLAIFLAACAVVMGLVSVVGIALLATSDLYTSDLNEWMDNRRENTAYNLADQILRRYTATELGQCSRETLAYTSNDIPDREISMWYGIDQDSWYYSITDRNGWVVDSTYTDRLQDNMVSYDFTMSCEYPVDVSPEELDTFDDSLSPWRDYYVSNSGEHYLYYFPSPVYTVTIWMLPDAVSAYNGMTFHQAAFLYEIRYLVIAALGVSLLIFILCLVYLCVAAGKKDKSAQIRAGGLNRMPLDIYLAIATAAFIGGAAVFFLVIDNISFSSFLDPGILALSIAALLVASAVIVAFLFAAAAQFKMPCKYWWHNSVLGRIWKHIGKGFRLLFRGIAKLFNLLPLIWQWLLTAATMVVVTLFFLFLTIVSNGISQAFWALFIVTAIFADIGIILYGAYSFGILLKGAKQMSEGNLNAKVPTKYLYGAFRDFADHLNALSDVAVIAAQNQMKSERMKTELITNVSHDIKTPLTSIINYVDLLEKPHSEEEGVQYLEVLSRQSLRLKKLIDDLMEMSKASTGNMQVSITTLDMTETVNQALGEFSDKLSKADLTVVFRQPEQPVTIQADGRLTWRVLSNLLSNIVKYALPGTRVYVDIIRYQNTVLLSLKNISREELNVSADELTERFVRGDASRNTEGSGLGLNIAQSLMELQKGQLSLLVDGDLFKVTLTFPTL